MPSNMQSSMERWTVTNARMTAPASNEASAKRKIEWFAASEAPDLADSGIMTPAVMNAEIREKIDFTALREGSRTRVLYHDSAPDGFSLVHVWFGENYPLPRHTHSADCLYYVLRGELRMGSTTVTAGNGMFIPADRPYTYRAGPGGVEVLEFRASTSFDAQTLDQDLAKWQTFATIAEKMQETWIRTRPADDR